MRRGFTLVELMITVAILGTLASIAIPRFDAMSAKARRVEAVAGLNVIRQAQYAYFAENERFAATFEHLGFAVPGGSLISPTKYKGGRYTYQLSQPWGPGSFYSLASGNLDPDPFPDILEAYEVPGLFSQSIHAMFDDISDEYSPSAPGPTAPPAAPPVAASGSSGSTSGSAGSASGSAGRSSGSAGSSSGSAGSASSSAGSSSGSSSNNGNNGNNGDNGDNGGSKSGGSKSSGGSGASGSKSGGSGSSGKKD